MHKREREKKELVVASDKTIFKPYLAIVLINFPAWDVNINSD